jgi:arylformamidase
MTPESVERGYNNRAAVPDHPRWIERYTELSEATRAVLAPMLDLRYGPGPKETLDLFMPPGAPLATFVFFHGGYWRAFDKTDFSFVATPFVAQGIAVAVINYDLCPDVSIATIVEQSQHAIGWIVRDGAAHGLNTEPLIVGGHSAGGHLAAMLLTTDWETAGLERDPIAGVVSVSGMHDLAPMVLFSFNTDLKLDAAEAARLSPVNLTPRTHTPVVIAAGADETSEFVRQSWILWERWPENRPEGMTGPLLVPDRNHFSIIADYADPASDLTRATLALF